MKNYLFLLIAASVLVLGGCTTAPGKFSLPFTGNDLTDYNIPNFQGCTVVEYIEEAGKEVRFWDCKDKSQVAVVVDLNSDGQPDFSYDASDIVGSEAAAIRAEVEKVFAERGAEVGPDVVEGVVDAILGL